MFWRERKNTFCLNFIIFIALPFIRVFLTDKAPAKCDDRKKLIFVDFLHYKKHFMLIFLLVYLLLAMTLIQIF